MELVNRSISQEEDSKEIKVSNYSEPEKRALENRTYTASEYFQIMDTADLLQIAEQRKSEHKAAEDLEGLALKGIDNFSELRVYEHARELGIDDRYVTQAIRLIKPSNSQKLEDLKKIGAYTFFRKDLLEAYSKFLPNELKKTYPNEDFGYEKKTETIEFYRINKKAIKKTFLWKSWYENIEERTRLARIWVANGKDFKVNIDLDSPIFLIACSETLKKLHENFNTQISNLNRYYTILPEGLETQ